MVVDQINQQNTTSLLLNFKTNNLSAPEFQLPLKIWAPPWIGFSNPLINWKFPRNGSQEESLHEASYFAYFAYFSFKFIF